MTPPTAKELLDDWFPKTDMYGDPSPARVVQLDKRLLLAFAKQFARECLPEILKGSKEAYVCPNCHVKILHRSEANITKKVKELYGNTRNI